MEKKRIWVFRTFTTPQAERTGRYFHEVEFDDFNEMKTFSSEISVDMKRNFPKFTSTYFDKP